MTESVCSYKICLVGDTGVGKSSIAVRYVFDKFNDFEPTTIGASYMCKNIRVRDKMIKLELWDTAGQERYRSLAPLYYREAHTIIIVADGSKTASITQAEWWINDIRSRNPDTPIIIALSKSDLTHNVEPANFKNIYQDEVITCIPVSSKTGEKVHELFEHIVKDLLEKNVLFSERGESVILRETPRQNRCWWF